MVRCSRPGQLLPRLRLPAGGLEHVATEGEDLTGLLGDGDEGDAAGPRRAPDGSSASAPRRRARRRRRWRPWAGSGRLISPRSSACRRSVAIWRRSSTSRSISGLNTPDALLAAALGDVEGDVRGAEGVGGVVTRVHRRDPAAGVEDDGPPADLDGAARSPRRGLRRWPPLRRGRHRRARRRTRRRRGGRGSRRVAGPAPGGRADLDQRVVAGAVAEPVVQLLEVVEVEEHDRPFAVAAADSQVPEQAGAVGQAGERVVEGLVLEGGERVPPAGRPSR